MKLSRHVAVFSFSTALLLIPTLSASASAPQCSRLQAKVDNLQTKHTNCEASAQKITNRANGVNNQINRTNTLRDKRQAGIDRKIAKIDNRYFGPDGYLERCNAATAQGNPEARSCKLKERNDRKYGRLNASKTKVNEDFDKKVDKLNTKKSRLQAKASSKNQFCQLFLNSRDCAQAELGHCNSGNPEPWDPSDYQSACDGVTQ